MAVLLAERMVSGTPPSETEGFPEESKLSPMMVMVPAFRSAVALWMTLVATSFGLAWPDAIDARVADRTAANEI
jgi:hypothetical protein